MNWSLRICLAAPAVLTMALLGGCGGPQVYRDETFAAESPFQRSFPQPVAEACEGARRALLSQGYVVDDVRHDRLKGIKAFQPARDIHEVIEFHVVCTDAGGATAMYANAVQSRYDLKKSRQSAGVSVPSIGSISLPWGETTDSLVKVAGETVSDKDFYDRFFNLVGQLLAPQKR
ncbi:MAG: DUF2242 domain-containing protein [Burkholderiales bacterium]